MPTAHVGPADLFYTDDGVNGPPLLLVHGWTCDSHDWSFQFEPFTARHRVIAVDLRGHGRSSSPESGYDVRTFAADLAALLDQLGTGPVIAIGHSLGGNVVSALQAARPDLVSAIVAVEPAYGVAPATAEFLSGVVPALGTPAGNVVAADALASLEPSTPTWLRIWHRRRILGMEPRVVKESFENIYFSADQIAVQPRTDDFLAGRTVPVLAFHRLPAMATWEESTFRHPASRAVSWEGAGHWLHQERIQEFNDLTLDWIAGLPG